MTTKQNTDTLAPDALEVMAAVAPLAPVAWTSTAWMDAMTKLTTAVTSFMAERVKEDIQTQQALLQCKSLTEVQHVQAEFVQKAVAQYQAETGKLIEVTTQLANDLHVKPGSVGP